MRKILFFSVTLFLLVLTLLVVDGKKAMSQPTGKDNGWFPAGSNPKNYTMEVTPAAKHTGSKGGMIKYTSSNEPTGFGTYMQMHQPGAWAGKKVKMTGYVRTEDVSGWCGMWCRIDGADGKETIDFDNMGDRPIKGTTDWTKYEITVNITKDASAIAYGVLLNGKGTAFFDDITFEVLGDADLSKLRSRVSADKPANLNFEN